MRFFTLHFPAANPHLGSLKVIHQARRHHNCLLYPPALLLQMSDVASLAPPEMRISVLCSPSRTLDLTAGPAGIPVHWLPRPRPPFWPQCCGEHGGSGTRTEVPDLREPAQSHNGHLPPVLHLRDCGVTVPAQLQLRRVYVSQKGQRCRALAKSQRCRWESVLGSPRCTCTRMVSGPRCRQTQRSKPQHSFPGWIMAAEDEISCLHGEATCPIRGPMLPGPSPTCSSRKNHNAAHQGPNLETT